MKYWVFSFHCMSNVSLPVRGAWVEIVCAIPCAR